VDLPRIYLDNAATSWPKPDSVYRAVDEYQRLNGAAAGRGVYRSAQSAERVVSQCRKRLADLLGAKSPQQIIFTLNGTDSLNVGLQGILRPGDHVVTSVCEHNSVLRPLHALRSVDPSIAFDAVGCNSAGVIDPVEVRRAIQPNTRLLAFTHASNVTGALQPLREIGQIAKERGIFFLVDAAQSLGHLPLDVNELGCHLLASPGHKGLLGPLGTGLLYISPGVETELKPIRQGGTGTRSDEPEQPASLPDRYESGNLNVPGIAGLNAGVAWLLEKGLAEIHQHEAELRLQLVSELRQIPNVTVYGPSDSSQSVGVVSFNIGGFDPQEVAAALDAAAGLELRAGLHCSPLMHEALQTAPAGTVRASFGPFTTAADIAALVAAVREFA
jgi:cysteine desulfurase / selenocysteine lyase